MSKPGYIMREGYHRSGYYRKAYTKSDGTHVKSSYVKPTYVPPTLIKDRSAHTSTPHFGKAKDIRHLDEFGYKFSLPVRERHKALQKAADSYGKSWAIHRLNYIKNLQHHTNPSVAKKAEKDIEYVREL